MSLYITCPRCHASLKANKLPSHSKTVNCPECSHPFQVATTGVTAALPQPKIGGDSEAMGSSDISAPTSHNAMGLGIAVVAAILLVGGGIVAAIVFTRQELAPLPPPLVIAAKDKVETPKVEDPKDLDKRRQEFIRHMIEGGTSLIGQRYDEAVSAYSEAAKLFPDDADAKQKLVEAQVSLSQQRQKQADADKLTEDAVQLTKNGQSALEKKAYAAAVDFFKLALQKHAGNTDAAKGLIDAQAAQGRKDLDEKKIAEYEQFILSGKAAQKAGRYADAVKAFEGALRIVPDDKAAMGFQREAEKQLDSVTDRAEKTKEFKQLVDQANLALRSKSYEDAEKAFERALRLFPKDADALQGVESVRKSLKQAKAEYTARMNQGALAANSGRFGDAVLAFREATRLLPNDETAARALRQAEVAQENQTNYFRAMERGASAMSLRQFADAVVAYGEAVRIAPNDVPAGLGLRDAQRALEADLIRRKDFDRRSFTGLQLLKSQRYADAVIELRAALKIMPLHPQADIVERQARYGDAMAQGTSALTGKRFNEAISQFQAALSVFPNDFAARSGLNKAQAGNKGAKS